MCAVDPRIRLRSSPWRPVMRARATTSARTPTATPMVENSDTREIDACCRRARRYRRATNSSNGTMSSHLYQHPLPVSLWPESEHYETRVKQSENLSMSSLEIWPICTHNLGTHHANSFDSCVPL